MSRGFLTGRHNAAPPLPMFEKIVSCNGLMERMFDQAATSDISKPPTVLVIDDNHDERAHWSASLKQAPFGFLVLEADCGGSGYKLFQKQHIDCVVLDLEMPESGLFTLLRLIPDPTRRHVPVVILSKLTQPALLKLMKSLGAYECLVKEYCSAEKLAQTIREAIVVVKSERAV
jgi:CheY-like chemotaxis protein